MNLKTIRRKTDKKTGSWPIECLATMSFSSHSFDEGDDVVEGVGDRIVG